MTFSPWHASFSRTRTTRFFVSIYRFSSRFDLHLDAFHHIIHAHMPYTFSPDGAAHRSVMRPPLPSYSPPSPRRICYFHEPPRKAFLPFYFLYLLSLRGFDPTWSTTFSFRRDTTPAHPHGHLPSHGIPPAIASSHPFRPLPLISPSPFPRPPSSFRLHVLNRPPRRPSYGTAPSLSVRLLTARS